MLAVTRPDYGAPDVFVEVPGSVGSLPATLLPIPASYKPNNDKDPGDQPWVPYLVEVPGIEPGSVLCGWRRVRVRCDQRLRPAGRLQLLH